MMNQEEEIQICHHCGAKMVEYSHAFNSGHAESLWKLWRSGGKKNIQTIGLTHNQYTNFYKLRYWGLAKQVEDIRGGWEITPFGKAFLFGKKTIQQNAISYRGEPKGFEGDVIGIRTHLPEEYQQNEDYLSGCRNHSFREEGKQKDFFMGDSELEQHENSKA